MVVDPLTAALAVVVGSGAEKIGRFAFDRPSDTWEWSDEIYTMYGFAAHEVVPTTALMAAHRHPDDRVEALPDLLDTIGAERPFASRYRILDSRQNERLIVTVGVAERDGAGEVRRISGFMIDITGGYRRDLAESTHAAVAAAGASRAAIDQAKGALMLIYGMDDDAAFELLKWYSQRANIKLRELAETLAAAASQGMPVGGDSRRRLDEVFFGLAGGQVANAPTAEPGELASTVDQSNDIPVLKVVGDLDLSTGPQFTAMLATLVGQVQRPNPVVVDLTELGHLGSVGLAVLSQFHRRCQGKGTPLRVAFGDLSSLPSVRSAGLLAFDTVSDALSG